MPSVNVRVSVRDKPSTVIVKEKVYPSEIEGLKSKEFEKRRKLRLLQVRQQSNEIARSVRERADKERIKQLGKLSEHKREEFTKRKDTLVQGLVHTYSESIQAIGIGHRTAEETILQEQDQNKENLDNANAKRRGYKAAEVLKEKKQLYLDEQKRGLDQKLLARLVANERSKQVLKTLAEEPEPAEPSYNKVWKTLTEKPAPPAPSKNKTLKTLTEKPEPPARSKNKKITDKLVDENTECLIQSQQGKSSASEIVNNSSEIDQLLDSNQKTSKTSTVNKQQSSIPSDQITPKDLFSVSDDMPSPLLGSRTRSVRHEHTQPSLSIVSNFLQTRNERFEPRSKHKTTAQTLQNPKEVIMRVSNVETESRAPSTSKYVAPRSELVTEYDHRNKSILSIPKTRGMVNRHDQNGFDAYQAAANEIEEEVVQDVSASERKRKSRGRKAGIRDKMVEEYSGTMEALKKYAEDKNKERKNSYAPDIQKLMKNLEEQKRLKEELVEVRKTTTGLPWVCKESDNVLPNTSTRLNQPPKTSTRLNQPSKSSIHLNETAESSTTCEVESYTDDCDDALAKNVFSISDAESLLHYLNVKANSTKHMKRAGRAKEKKKHMTDTCIGTKHREHGVWKVARHTPDESLPKSEKTSKPASRTVREAKSQTQGTSSVRKIEIKYVDTSTQVQLSPKSSVGSFKTTCPNKSSRSGSTVTLTENQAWNINVASDGDQKSTDNTDKDSLKGNRDKDSPKHDKGKDSLIVGKKTDPLKDSKDSLKAEKDKDSLKVDKKTDPLKVGKDSLNAEKDKDSLKGNKDSIKVDKGKEKDRLDFDLKAGGYIKVLDENGEEAGKFYIGSCKPFEENAFEIVIQLKRKPEDGKGDKSSYVKQYDDKGVMVDEEPIVSTPDYCNSSSTVYFSPPDAMLPSFLKNGYAITRQELNATPPRKAEPVCKRLYEYDPTLAPTHRILKPISKNSHFSKKRRTSPNKTRGETFGEIYSEKSKKKQGFHSDRGDAVNVQKAKANVKKEKINLDPILKKYIHELLEMGKDEVKQLPVSAVTSICTPGSSIIDVSTNKRKCVKDALLQSLLDSVRDNDSNTFDIKSFSVNKNASTINKLQQSTSSKSGTYDVRRSRKIRRRHKIKTVNISKNVNKYLRVNVGQLEHKKSFYYLASSKGDSQTPLKVVPQTPVIKKIETKVGAMDIKSDQSQNDKNKQINEKKIKKNYHNLKKSISSPQLGSLNETNLEQDLLSKSDEYQQQSSVTEKKPKNVKEKNCEKCKKIKQNQHPPDQEQELQKKVDFLKKESDSAKISDLTDKCSKRISDLVKVLDEVRKNKTELYAPISSDSLSSPDKSKHKDKTNVNPVTLKSDNSDFVPLLGDIPKPFHSKVSNVVKDVKPVEDTKKVKSKPPPALARAFLDETPHELSTVVEVETPKSTNSGKHSKSYSPSNFQLALCSEKRKHSEIPKIDPDGKSFISQQLEQLPILDIEQFNELMLKPFKTFEEYVKQCNLSTPIEISKLEDLIPQPVSPKQNKEESSSDGTLPDIVAELLKRNVIKEPFNFEDPKTHTTLSSDSSSSLVLLEKLRKKVKKKAESRSDESKKAPTDSDLDDALCKLRMFWASSTLKKTKEASNLPSSTSTSASSTTKEYVKLQKKSKAFRDLSLISDSSDNLNLNTSSRSSSSATSGTKQSMHQQTSDHLLHTKEISVMGFLTQELADKITFSNPAEEQSEHFTTLHTTNPNQDSVSDKSKRPLSRGDEMKDRSESGDGRDMKRRTSTPVQLFKASNYNSSSSSVNNYSNSLFSNVDELSSVKGTSKNQSSSEKDDLVVPNDSLDIKKFIKSRNDTS